MRLIFSSSVLMPLLAAALLAAGCSSAKPINISSADYGAVCSADGIRTAQDNLDALGHIQVGVTSWKDIRELRRPVRRVPLIHPAAEPLTVAFYMTGMPGCPLLQPASALFTPVVLRGDGVVLGYGQRTMDELHAQGWLLGGTAWQWQAYNNAYLPMK